MTNTDRTLRAVGCSNALKVLCHCILTTTCARSAITPASQLREQHRNTGLAGPCRGELPLSTVLGPWLTNAVPQVKEATGLRLEVSVYGWTCLPAVSVLGFVTFRPAAWAL